MPSLALSKFTHYLIHCTIFENKFFNNKWVFWTPLQWLSETFLIKRSRCYNCTCVFMWSATFSCHILTKLKILYTRSKNIHILNLITIRPVGTETLEVDGKTDWATGRHVEANSRFSAILGTRLTNQEYDVTYCLIQRAVASQYTITKRWYCYSRKSLWGYKQLCIVCLQQDKRESLS